MQCVRAGLLAIPCGNRNRSWGWSTASELTLRRRWMRSLLTSSISRKMRLRRAVIFWSTSTNCMLAKFCAQQLSKWTERDVEPDGLVMPGVLKVVRQQGLSPSQHRDRTCIFYSQGGQERMQDLHRVAAFNEAKRLWQSFGVDVCCIAILCRP